MAGGDVLAELEKYVLIFVGLAVPCRLYLPALLGISLWLQTTIQDCTLLYTIAECMRSWKYHSSENNAEKNQYRTFMLYGRIIELNNHLKLEQDI